MRRSPLLLAVLALAGCERRSDIGPIDVSVIGPQIDRALPGDAADRGPLDAPSAALVAATGEGLVRFDAQGQLVAGLAARWSVSGDGRSLLFRLPDDAPPLAAQQVARRLRAAARADGGNPLAPLLGAVATVTAVTPQVIDVELSAPRPALLPLFAQPELGIGAAGRGGGPFRIAALAGGVATLRALPDRDADPDETPPLPLVVRLRGERAGVALVRFVAGRAALVTGGTFADLPVARAAGVPGDRLRFDPVQGLFGLAFTAGAGGIAATAEGRRALAMAIDRERIARAIDAPGWRATDALLPDDTPEIATAAQPDWAALSRDERRAAAIATVAALPEGAPPLRVAMPDGPGARLLFALIAADWRAIGVAAVAVPEDADADLRMIDLVAPADTAAFYLRRFACARDVPCTPASEAALTAARIAPTLDARAALLAEADRLIEANAPFVALGAPVRWSLVAPALDRFRESPRGRHPLDELRGRPAR